MRRRYVQLDNGELVEVSLYARLHDSKASDGVLWGDRGYDVGDARFHSRTSHRSYMRARGLTTADDYKEEWRRAQKQRDDFYTTGGKDPSRAGDVARALDAVARGYKPNRFREGEF